MSSSQLPFQLVSLLRGAKQITIVNDNARRPAISATLEKSVRDNVSRIGSLPGTERIEIHPSLFNRWAEINKLPKRREEDNPQEQKLSLCRSAIGTASILHDQRSTAGEVAALSKIFDASPKIPRRQESLDDLPDEFDFYLNLLQGQKSTKSHRTGKPRRKRNHLPKTIDFLPKMPYRQESLDE